MIPMAALVGVMFMVVIGTFEWASLRMFGKMPPSDLLVMVLVAAYTAVMHDLATAVILGVIVSALVFAWQHAKHIGADIKTNEFGSKIYQLHGPLFFASVSGFKDLFDPKNDPDDVVIDFYYTRVYDQSGLEAINSLAEKYAHQRQAAAPDAPEPRVPRAARQGRRVRRGERVRRPALPRRHRPAVVNVPPLCRNCPGAARPGLARCSRRPIGWMRTSTRGRQEFPPHQILLFGIDAAISGVDRVTFPDVKRQLFTVLAALSLILCVSVCILWTVQ